MRPDYLADDHAGTVPVIKHAIETLTKHGDAVIKDVFCIYPCSPLLNSRDLIDAYELYMEIGNWNNYLFSIAQYHSAPQRAFTLRNDLKTIPMYPEYERVRTQDLEQTYFDAGQFYCGAKDLCFARHLC
jgi:N-acylneuraminate cytidylyltransferase